MGFHDRRPDVPQCGELERRACCQCWASSPSLEMGGQRPLALFREEAGLVPAFA